MKYKIFAICDPEREYAVRFSDYVRQHGNLPMDVRMFTGIEELVTFMRERPVEILLLSEQLIRDDISEWPVETLVILQSSHEKEEACRYSHVYKYRSARDLIRTVMTIYGEKEQTVSSRERILKPACRVIGVYSPVAGCFKTSFALALGQILSKEKPVLYLNLEDFSGLEQILCEQFDSNISDLIYIMRQGEKDLISRMLPMTGHIAALDFIPPCVSGQELRGVSPEEWHRLFREIMEHSSYEVIIIDLGNGLGHLEDLLTECEIIYMPVRVDGCSRAKAAAFEKFLKMSGAERVSGRIRQMQMNIANLPENRDRYMQQIVWSDVGDYARTCIMKDSL